MKNLTSYIKTFAFKRVVQITVLSCIIAAIAGVAIYINIKQPKTEIITSKVTNVSQGRVLDGETVGPKPTILQTENKLTFESDELEPSQQNANAVAIIWNQSDDKEGVEIQIRTFNGQKWSEWVHSDDQQDSKDGAKPVRSILALNENIKKVQYGIILEGEPGQPSPEVDLEKTMIEMIDTTRGPSPTKTNMFKKTLEKIGLTKKVSARADGPRIYSRAEWGSPEPNSSPDWPPEYEDLYRGIVHHTVTGSGDSASIMRAVWHFHTYTRGWGDIGYNYTVDQDGNIFQGRYFDHNLAHNSRKDVVGGHTLHNNRGTTGIAALGDFTSVRPSDRMVDSIANIIAFKSANYYFNPSGIGANGPNVIGHRNAGQTSCPGEQLYNRLGDIRRVGDLYYGPRVTLNQLDLTNQGQGYEGNFAFDVNMLEGETREAYFDLKNEGDNTWGNYGTHPVVLGTDQPRDRASIFATAGSWRSVDRAATFSKKVVTETDGSKTLVDADSINPGEVGRFSFIITAPGAEGTYREHFQLLIENREWFSRNLLLSTTINVAPKIYSWQPVGQHIFTNDQQTTHATTTNLSPGQEVFLVIKAKNTGNQAWYNNGPNPLRAGTSNRRDRTSPVCDSTWLNCNRPVAMSEASVVPGEIGTFGFWIKAPNTPGYTGTEYFSLVAENRTWANTEPGIFWPISVSQ